MVKYQGNFLGFFLRFLMPFLRFFQMNSALGQNDRYLRYISAIWEGPLVSYALLLNWPKWYSSRTWEIHVRCLIFSGQNIPTLSLLNCAFVEHFRKKIKPKKSNFVRTILQNGNFCQLTPLDHNLAYASSDTMLTPCLLGSSYKMRTKAPWVPTQLWIPSNRWHFSSLSLVSSDTDSFWNGVYFSPPGSYVLADVTIYRAKANLPSQGASVNVSAIGTASGQDGGGTTYIEEKLFSSMNVVYSSPPITSLITNVRTETGSYSAT